MSLCVSYEVGGLYPEERDYILKKLELIKEKVYDNFRIDFSILKSSPNYITAYCYFEDDDSALDLFRLLNVIVVPNIRTDYDDYIPLNEREVPSMKLELVKDMKFEDYNTDKGLNDN